jgi:hypothetical protein
MSIRALIKDYPHRTIALTTGSHILTFRHSTPASDHNGLRSASQTSLGGNSQTAPKCMVEFTEARPEELEEYRNLSPLPVHGTLGLITVNNDVFLCVVSAANKVAAVRPNETVLRILSVEFRTWLSPPIATGLLNVHLELAADGTEELG